MGDVTRQPRIHFDAVILAGGGARRLGGADKPGLMVGGRTLAAAVVAASGEADTVIIVGPERAELRRLRPGRELRFVREEPPGAGPVAALRRGIEEVSAAWVAVLAADLPFLGGYHLQRLLTAVVPAGARTRSGAILVDDAGRPQWLAGCWQTAALRTDLRVYRGQSLRGLFAPLRPAVVALKPDPGEPPPWFDCDSPEDVRRAREWRP